MGWGLTHEGHRPHPLPGQDASLISRHRYVPDQIADAEALAVCPRKVPCIQGCRCCVDSAGTTRPCRSRDSYKPTLFILWRSGANTMRSANTEKLNHLRQAAALLAGSLALCFATGA